MSPARKTITLREYRQRPEEAGVQLIGGSLVMEDPPGLFHQGIVVNIALIVIPFVRAQRLGKVYLGPVGVYLSDRDALLPDVMFVANENLGLLQDDGAHGAPDLVVEVLSPSTARVDEKTKRDLYCRHGVKEMWLVDPRRRRIRRFEFARDDRNPIEVIEESGWFSSPLFPGLALSAAEIFRE